MTTRYVGLCAAAVLAAIAFQGTSANALTMAECGAKYKAAKADGTLNGQNGMTSARRNAAPKLRLRRPPRRRRPPPPPAPAAAPAPSPKPAAAPVAVGNAVFPNAVDSKYSKDSEGKGRMLTCLDQYKANKANNGNGGLKWIQKGGGYYSECNKHLKGA